MSIKSVRVYLWPDEHGWDDAKTEELIEAFEHLSTSKDKKAAIGAGASGILPELNVLIEFASTPFAQLLVAGFVGAMGGDVWELLKKGLLKAIKVKPKPQDLSEYGKGTTTEFELNLWIHLADESFLMTLVLSDEKEIEQAINQLPQGIDKAVKSGKEFRRLYWMDGEWKAL